MMVPRAAAVILFRPPRLLFFSIVISLISFYYISKSNRQNPNSHFFEPDEHTYEATNSGPRKAAGRKYLAEQNALLGREEVIRQGYVPSSSPLLGVVFITVRRKTEQYLDASLGSFLRELTDEERSKMHITVNIGDFNPLDHPFYEEAWLHGLVDQVGVRMATKHFNLRLPPNVASKSRLARIEVSHIPVVDVDKSPLMTSPWHRKATLDYAFALTTCADIGAPHCLIVEDDTVFSKDWFGNIEPMLRRADRLTLPHHWGYIRLFWAEKYWGWEDYEVPKLVTWCCILSLGVAISSFVFCRQPPSRHPREKEKERDYQKLSGLRNNEAGKSRLPLISILLLVLFSLVHAVLFILAGRNHVYGVPHGLSKMPSRGCCTQAIIYPKEVVSTLSSHLNDHSGDRPYDIMINRWMESQSREKLAFTPPLVQHIGEGSSREMVAEYWRRTPLWSFAFEKQPIQQSE